MTLKPRWVATFVSAAVLLAACSQQRQTIRPVEQIDLPRFMGDWYVVAHIPTFIERDAYNAIESYALSPDGEIKTTFRYRNGSFDSPIRTLHPAARVDPDSRNAVWEMRFIWPIRAQYIIAYIDHDYQQTIIARDARDYVWIMARSPTISDEDYKKLVGRVEQLGYSTALLRKVPQQQPLLHPPKQ